MSVLVRFGLITCVVFLGGIVLVFVLENQQPASLLFFGRSTSLLPISVYIGGALLIGMLISPIAIWLRASVFRRKIPRR